jgi:hypothetical protein
MRLVFESYAIYSAIICCALTSILTLGFGDHNVEFVAKKVINISFLMYGPVMFTICMYGLKDINALACICTVHGISEHSNFISVFVLFSCILFSLGVTFTMAMEETLDMSSSAFRDENSILYRTTSIYF